MPVGTIAPWVQTHTPTQEKESIETPCSPLLYLIVEQPPLLTKYSGEETTDVDVVQATGSLPSS